jgi:pimeloyl-ACP methyl ester carboxylesterase
MGGYLAAAYALQHPEHVAQLILVSPVGVPRKPSDWDERMQNRFAPTYCPCRLCRDYKICRCSGFMWKTLGSLWNRGYTPQGDSDSLSLTTPA